MKNFILVSFLTLFVTSISAQVGQARLLKVNDGQMQEFSEGISEKTQKYNRSEESDQYFTFRILSGPNTNDFIRVRWMESIGELDSNSAGMKELNFWNKNVVPYYTEGTSRIWSRNNGVSYVPEDATGNLRRVIYYNYKDSGEWDFWRFRQRVKRAMEESGYESAMNVLWCSSGCSGNWVQVRFHHDGFTGQASDYGEPLQNMISKYNEIFGEDAYDQDSASAEDALVEDGRRIRHLMLIPEMSSVW